MTTPATMPAPPPCVFVTGPAGEGRLRWIDNRIREIHTGQPGTPCALLLAETPAAGAKRFAGRAPKLEVHCLAMPCLCCPALADLPGAVRTLVGRNRAEWLLVELPALPAPTLIAEFDRRVGWPREIVVWLNRSWVRDRQAGLLSVFQENLIAMADRVVADSGEPPRTPDASVTEVSFLPPPLS